MLPDITALLDGPSYTFSSFRDGDELLTPIEHLSMTNSAQSLVDVADSLDFFPVDGTGSRKFMSLVLIGDLMVLSSSRFVVFNSSTTRGKF